MYAYLYISYGLSTLCLATLGIPIDISFFFAHCILINSTKEWRCQSMQSSPMLSQVDAVRILSILYDISEHWARGIPHQAKYYLTVRL
jgi:hypothetical protein